MASILKVDTITGVTTAGSIAVTGEGNSTTTNLQQGLIKSWVNLNGTSTIATRDSFNVGSLTDNGTGDYSINFSNNMSNGNYSITSGVNNYEGQSDNRFFMFIKGAGSYDWSTMATGSYRTISTDVDNGLNAIDSSLVSKSVQGDLA